MRLNFDSLYQKHNGQKSDCSLRINLTLTRSQAHILLYYFYNLIGGPGGGASIRGAGGTMYGSGGSHGGDGGAEDSKNQSPPSYGSFISYCITFVTGGPGGGASIRGAGGTMYGSGGSHGGDGGAEDSKNQSPPSYGSFISYCVTFITGGPGGGASIRGAGGTMYGSGGSHGGDGGAEDSTNQSPPSYGSFISYCVTFITGGPGGGASIRGAGGTMYGSGGSHGGDGGAEDSTNQSPPSYGSYISYCVTFITGGPGGGASIRGAGGTMYGSGGSHGGDGGAEDSTNQSPPSYGSYISYCVTFITGGPGGGASIRGAGGTMYGSGGSHGGDGGAEDSTNQSPPSYGSYISYCVTFITGGQGGGASIRGAGGTMYGSGGSHGGDGGAEDSTNQSPPSYGSYISYCVTFITGGPGGGASIRGAGGTMYGSGGSHGGDGGAEDSTNQSPPSYGSFISYCVTFITGGPGGGASIRGAGGTMYGSGGSHGGDGGAEDSTNQSPPSYGSFISYCVTFITGGPGGGASI